jgi:hypothetical protein
MNANKLTMEGKMKISYQPQDINNFHNVGPLNLVVGGRTIDWSGRETYLISPRQARKINKHFCGITDCRCSGGATYELNEDRTGYGIPVKYRR